MLLIKLNGVYSIFFFCFFVSWGWVSDMYICTTQQLCIIYCIYQADYLLLSIVSIRLIIYYYLLSISSIGICGSIGSVLMLTYLLSVVLNISYQLIIYFIYSYDCFVCFPAHHDICPKVRVDGLAWV